MSDKVKEGQKTDGAKTEDLANAFKQIMALRQAKKPDSSAKDQYRLAKDALDPFLVRKEPKSIGELGWLAADHAEFTNVMVLVKKARGGKLSSTNWKAAAEQSRKALEIAKAAQDKKILRDRIKADAAKTNIVLQGLLTLNKQAHDELLGQLNQQLTALNSATTMTQLDQIAVAVQNIKIEARGRASELAPQSSELSKTRAKLQLSLNLAINEEDKKLGALAFQKFPQGKITFVEAEIRALTDEKFQACRDTLLAKADNSKLTTDPERIKSLNERHAAALKEVQSFSLTIENRIKNDTGSLFKQLVDGQADFRKGLDLTAAAKKFEEDFVAVERGLAELRDLGAPHADVLTQNAAKDKETMLRDKAFKQAPLVIKSFLDQIAVAKKNAEAAAGPEGDKLESDAATLRKAVTKQSTSDSRITPAYKKLIAELDQLDVIVATNNTGALVSGRQRLEAIRAAALGATVATMKQLTANADAIALVTSDKVVAKEFGPAANDILLAVKTAFKDLDLYEAAKGAQIFADLKKEADLLKQDAAALVQWRIGIGERLAAVTRMITEFRKLVPGEKPTTFELNAKDAKEKYDKPGVDRAEIDKLVAEAERTVYPMINNLREAGPGQNRTIDALEKDFAAAGIIVQKAEQKKTDDKTRHDNIEKGINAFKANLIKAKKAVEKDPNGDKEELSELTVLLDQVVKKFKAKDEEGAEKQLKSIEKRMTSLLTKPGGVTAESVDALKGVATLWDNAMQDMRNSMDAINTAAGLIAPAAKGDPKEIEARINKIYNRFTPFKTTLVQSVLELCEAEKSKLSKEEHAKLLKTRKAAREMALRDVRSLRTLLDGDPAIARLATNPFAVKSPFVEMRKFIASIEYNSLRAVPPE